MANTNGFIKMAVGALVVIIVAAGVILPLFASAEVTAGDKITYENTVGSELYVTDDVKGTYTFTADASTATYTYNGETLESRSNGFYIVTDTASIMHTGATFVISWGNDSYQIGWSRTVNATFTDGTATIVYSPDGGTTTETFTHTYSWIGYRVDTGGNYLNTAGESSLRYYSGVSDFIAMGYYSSGDNDTFYVLKDGKLTISNPDTYTSSATVKNSTLVSGTTDIYQGTVEINVGDESFTPYIWAVAKEIDGHASSGLTYTIVSILPVIILVGVLVMTAAAFISNRRA